MINEHNDNDPVGKDINTPSSQTVQGIVNDTTTATLPRSRSELDEWTKSSESRRTDSTSISDTETTVTSADEQGRAIEGRSSALPCADYDPYGNYARYKARRLHAEKNGKKTIY